MRLNPYIGFAQYAGGTTTNPISNTGTMLGSEFSSAAEICLAKPSSDSYTSIQIFMKKTKDKTDVDGSLLVSSIFYQTLETNPFQFSF